MTELFFRNIKISKYFPEKMIFFIQKKFIGKQHFKKINHKEVSVQDLELVKNIF